MSDSPQSLALELDVPAVVELFQVVYNNETYYFTNTRRSTPICWSGNTYTPIPIEIVGVGYTEDNYSESPKLSLTNIGLELQVLFATIPMLEGSRLNYIKTFETYIFPTTTGNNSLFIHKNSFIFSKLLEKTFLRVTYELATFLTYNNKKMPSRQMLRDGPLNLRFEGLGVNKTIN